MQEILKDSLSPNGKKINQGLNELNLSYKIKNPNQNLRIFGNMFYENNVDNFKLFINEKEIKYIDKLSPEQLEGQLNILKVTLKEIKPVEDYSYLFFDCDSLNCFYQNHG